MRIDADIEPRTSPCFLGISNRAGHGQRSLPFEQRRHTSQLYSEWNHKVILPLIVLNVYAKDLGGDTADSVTDNFRVIKPDISRDSGEKAAQLWKGQKTRCLSEFQHHNALLVSRKMNIRNYSQNKKKGFMIMDC